MAASGLVVYSAEADSFNSMYSYGIHGSMPAVEAIQIYLATLGSHGCTIPMRVLSSDTIASVKMRIQAYKGFYTNQQRLVYAGRELTRDDFLMKDYGVSNGEVVHLVLRLSDLIDVNVKTVSGTEYLFRVGRNHSVRDLKQRISEKEGGLPLNQQALVFRGQQLEDQRRIEDLALEDDAVVHLVVRRTAKVRSKSVGADVELSIVAAGFEATKEIRHSVKVDETPGYSSVQFCGGTKLLPPVSDNVEQEICSVAFNDIGTKTLNGDHDILEPAKVSEQDMPDVLSDVFMQARAGLHAGFAPILSSEGSGGTYFFKDMYGAKSVGVFKPMDEEPMAPNNPRGLARSNSLEGLKKGTRIGEGAIREVAAYILDHPFGSTKSPCRRSQEGFSGVPPTMMVQCSHSAFHYNSETSSFDDNERIKVGSFQQFVHAFSNCEDMGPASFPVDEVHKIGVLDMRLANTDRNGANILVCKERGSSSLKLVPIDHGYCLPDKFEDTTFEWLYWPQARLPFCPSTLEYIDSLDAEADLALLSAHGLILRPECVRVLLTATMLLKKGAAAGLNPYQIGCLMCRERWNKESPVELMLEEVERDLLPASSERTFMDTLSDVMDRYLEDYLEAP